MASTAIETLLEGKGFSFEAGGNWTSGEGQGIGPATSSWWCSPLPDEDGSKWQDRSPEGLDQKVAPIVMESESELGSN